MNACGRAPDPHFSNAGSVVRLPWFFVNDTVSAQNCEPDMSAPLSAHRVALITYSGVPSITTDDRLLRDALVARGAEVDARPWDARADWGSYHRIVLRSCWNFHHHPAEFLLWINEVKDNHDGSLRNSPALVQWSVDKRYLLDLDAAGIAIVPTIWVSAPEGEAAPDLDALIAAQGWNEGAVVKPAISATAHQTWLVAPQRASEHQARFEALLASSQSGVMVQPFLPEIREGEWSLIFLGGEFSHAVVKRPVDGDFRVQHDFGGTVERREPEPITGGGCAGSAACCCEDYRDTARRDSLRARGWDTAGREVVVDGARGDRAHALLLARARRSGSDGGADSLEVARADRADCLRESGKSLRRSVGECAIDPEGFTIEPVERELLELARERRGIAAAHRDREAALAMTRVR
jgi:hypothetical protein